MKKILVVDDEMLLRNVLSDFLDTQQFEVLLAADAEQAFELVKEHKPHLALVDIQMPKITGIELTSKLKELYPELIIIIMTGYPSLDTAVNAMKNGASEYIIKPFRLVELKNMIKKYVD